MKIVLTRKVCEVIRGLSAFCVLPKECPCVKKRYLRNNLSFLMKPDILSFNLPFFFLHLHVHSHTTLSPGLASVKKSSNRLKREDYG